MARESAYAKADSERDTRVASSSLISRVPRVDPRAAAISDGFSGDLKQESSPYLFAISNILISSFLEIDFEINISDKKSRRFDLSEVIFKGIKVL